MMRTEASEIWHRTEVSNCYLNGFTFVVREEIANYVCIFCVSKCKTNAVSQKISAS